MNKHPPQIIWKRQAKLQKTELTNLEPLIETIKSKNGSNPALCPGEFSCTCENKSAKKEKYV